MGYEYFYQNIAEWLLLSMLIFIDSPLQILILDIFFNFFNQCSPYSHIIRSRMHSPTQWCGRVQVGTDIEDTLHKKIVVPFLREILREQKQGLICTYSCVKSLQYDE